MEKLQIFVQKLQELFQPENVPLILLAAACYGVAWFIMYKSGVLKAGEVKLKDAKAHNRKIIGHLDGKSQTVGEAPTITLPVTNQTIRFYRYRYFHPMYQANRFYVHRQRHKGYPAETMYLYYDENGRVFSCASEATIMGPFWKYIGAVVPGLVFAFLYQIFF